MTQYDTRRDDPAQFEDLLLDRRPRPREATPARPSRPPGDVRHCRNEGVVASYRHSSDFLRHYGDRQLSVFANTAVPHRRLRAFGHPLAAGTSAHRLVNSARMGITIKMPSSRHPGRSGLPIGPAGAAASSAGHPAAQKARVRTGRIRGIPSLCHVVIPSPPPTIRIWARKREELLRRLVRSGQRNSGLS